MRLNSCMTSDSRLTKLKILFFKEEMNRYLFLQCLCQLFQVGAVIIFIIIIQLVV